MLKLAQGDLLMLPPGSRIQVETNPEEAVEGCLLEFLIAGAVDSPMLAIKSDKAYVWKEERSWYYDPVAVLSQREELADWLAPAA